MEHLFSKAAGKWKNCAAQCEHALTHGQRSQSNQSTDLKGFFGISVASHSVALLALQGVVAGSPKKTDVNSVNQNKLQIDQQLRFGTERVCATNSHLFQSKKLKMMPNLSLVIHKQRWLNRTKTGGFQF